MTKCSALDNFFFKGFGFCFFFLAVKLYSYPKASSILFILNTAKRKTNKQLIWGGRGRRCIERTNRYKTKINCIFVLHQCLNTVLGTNGRRHIHFFFLFFFELHRNGAKVSSDKLKRQTHFLFFSILCKIDTLATNEPWLNEKKKKTQNKTLHRF
ncbi:hypothetical protein XENTR_v10007701 [Xenopus tropicalis]|nr:hypothetical protein XENTR_v10007701 [Xenopus tropicalis]